MRARIRHVIKLIVGRLRRQPQDFQIPLVGRRQQAGNLLHRRLNRQIVVPHAKSSTRAAWRGGGGVVGADWRQGRGMDALRRIAARWSWLPECESGTHNESRLAALPAVW